MKRLALVSLAALACCSVAPAEERFQRFDRDPNWDGANHRSSAFDERTVEQDFGYSATNHAQGQSTGELGGLITPAAETAYYAKPIQPRTFDNRLQASGVFLATGRQFHILVGFFNSKTLNEWRTPNTVGLRLYGRGDVFYAYVEYCTSKWRAGGDHPRPFAERKQANSNQQSPLEFAANVPHHWSLSYDPDANEGKGAVVATIDDYQAVCHLDEGHQGDGATFDRFGMMPILKQVDGAGQVWLDDIAVNGEIENFNVDPNWDARNNRRAYLTSIVRPRFDFGYCASHFAGGANAGELGGLVFRGDCRAQAKMAYYGDRLAPLTLEKPLRAGGKIALRRAVSDSTTLLGFFHAEKSMDVNDSQACGFPKNFLGIAIEGPSRDGFFVYPAYRTDSAGYGYASGPSRPVIYPDGRSHDWSLEYSPSGAGGRGEIVVYMNGETAKLALEEGDQKAGAQFNRFGLVTTWIDGNGQHVYFDDLTYTCQ